ncbi:hypothetical protein [Novipirellula artificiosorum]|uniref:Uncharacterized protein n=1 Tax=Novipirellula artificiosorum TaxID=2528016 RepID=A0A5C6DJV8_9BACT|nr:hypothetical protein [Novipirellula artificiosorum]TWU37018.1 hypothetical protein Poly41_31440 [Novipirellula artificiosorum]
MSTRRHLFAAIALAATQFIATDASACCLTDWLFGRTPVYVAGYTPAPATVCSADGCTTMPYAAGYAPVVSAPYVAGYPSAVPLAPPVTSQYQVSGVYQAQRPAYYQNPSVYTGLPVATSPSVQTSYRLPITNSATPFSGVFPTTANTVPLTQTYRGAAPTASFYNGGNAYPTQSYDNSYSAGYAGTAVPIGTPMTAVPATAGPPLYPVNSQPASGGLSRFFGSLFGTNYQTSYYSAPVTYYRPVTSVDPITGATVTTQQGCSSYEQQLQRTPYASLGNTPPTTVLPPSLGYGGTSYGAVGQAGALGSPYDRSVVPIPATGSTPSAYGPSTGYTPQNNTPQNNTPLMGTPSTTPSDAAPMSQPQLNSATTPYGSAYPYSASPSAAPRSTSPPSVAPPSMTPPSMTPPPSAWQLQNPADSNAFGSSSAASDQMISSTTSSSDPSQPQSNVRPIEAPPSYQSPFSRPTLQFEPSTDYKGSSPVAPALPPSSDYEINASSRDSYTNGIPVREAGLIRQQSYRQPLGQPKRNAARETGWYSLNP